MYLPIYSGIKVRFFFRSDNEVFIISAIKYSIYNLNSQVKIILHDCIINVDIVFFIKLWSTVKIYQDTFSKGSPEGKLK